MTRETQVVGIIETNINKEPSPIGFLSSYLPSTSQNVAVKKNEKYPPPYPIDASSSGTFPIPSSIIPIETSVKNHFIDKEHLVSPSAPMIYHHIDDEKQEIEKELSKLKIQMLNKSDDEKKIFLNSQHKLLMKIDSIRFRLSSQERNDFDKKMKEIDDIRMMNVENKNLHQSDEEIERKDENDDDDERIKKCAFDISSLLPKFPQLVVDIVLCVKGAMKGLMNVTGATYFIISLSASLFTAYYLILFCTCRRTKRIHVSEFLHSLMCTIVFLIVSFFSTADEQLRAFGFLASVPYGSEVCWKCWNYLFKKKF